MDEIADYLNTLVKTNLFCVALEKRKLTGKKELYSQSADGVTA
jgi:hypothetical protein